jgi:hypothetical protein
MLKHPRRPTIAANTLSAYEEVPFLISLVMKPRIHSRSLIPLSRSTLGTSNGLAFGLLAL